MEHMGSLECYFQQRNVTLLRQMIGQSLVQRGASFDLNKQEQKYTMWYYVGLTC